MKINLKHLIPNPILNLNPIPNLAPILIFLLFLTSSCSTDKTIEQDYPIKPVTISEVNLTDNFWNEHLSVNKMKTIPHALHKCEETGRLKNFRVAGGLEEGTFNSKYPFDDSDVFKVMEGASYSLIHQPDPELEAYLDTLIMWIAAAQEDDGYLYTYRTIMGEEADTGWAGTRRWEKTHMHSHELYNIGHLYEAAVAHHQATGKENFLDVALKSADLVCGTFGPEGIKSYPGHQEIEMGLVKLYRLTGDKKYLNTAKFLLGSRKGGMTYNQSHKPVNEQSEAVGHAVRACYMYSGMADIAALTGDSTYIDALDRIWEDVVGTKTYVTGGLGSVGDHEGFGEPYELPNEKAYCETCAAIANVFWNHKMFLLNEEAKYIDVLERSLYNNVLAGVSIGGTKFFYSNPLEWDHQYGRSEWFNCACCPSNISRFIPTMPSYIYAKTDNDLYVNLYVNSELKTEIAGKEQDIRVKSDFPLNGKVSLRVLTEEPGRFAIRFRYPGWMKGEVLPSDLYRMMTPGTDSLGIMINGEEAAYRMINGYMVIDREWQKGDAIQFYFPMVAQKIVAHANVEENTGKVAIQRGPLVFCVEGIDYPNGTLDGLALNPETELSPLYDRSFPGRILRLTGEQPSGKTFTALPYYGWANRQPGEMKVWVEYE